MRTFFLFAMTLAGTAAFTDDASAFGKRRHKADACGCCNTVGYVASAPACCGQTGVAYGGTYGVYGPRYGGYYYSNGMSPGVVYQSGYYTPGVSGSGVIPAGGTIDSRTGLPIAPRTVPNPMPDKEKPEIDK